MNGFRKVKRWIRNKSDVTAIDNGCWFDEEAGLRVVEFFHKYIRHSKGEWAGRPFELINKRIELPKKIIKAVGEWSRWEHDEIIMPLFGWKRRDGTRRFRRGYIEIPRKNGKSTLISGIGLYMTIGDQENGAEVYAAAVDKSQAYIVFGEARNMLDSSPELKKYMNSFRYTISVRKTNSFFHVLSADVPTKHGLNSHCNLIDELHAHKSGELFDVLIGGTGARRQPLTLSITTAGYDRKSKCWEEHEYGRKINDGIIKDDSFFAYISGIKEDEDWTNPVIWAKASPNIGVSLKLDFLKEEFKHAKESARYENTFKRLYLDMWTSQDVKFLSIERWAACSGEINIEQLKARTCFGGLDLSSTLDITAFVLLFPPENEGDKWVVLPYFWIPEDTIYFRAKKDRIPYDIWTKQEYIMSTPGNVIDDGFIKQFIVDLRDKFQIQEIGFDPWNATQISLQLESAGLKMVPVRQGFASMSPPTKQFEKMIIGCELNHGDNEVLNWMADNLAVREDPAGNLKPDKNKSTEKIDGIVALIIAIDRAMRSIGEEKSVYADRGVITF